MFVQLGCCPDGLGEGVGGGGDGAGDGAGVLLVGRPLFHGLGNNDDHQFQPCG